MPLRRMGLDAEQPLLKVADAWMKPRNSSGGGEEERGEALICEGLAQCSPSFDQPHDDERDAQ